MDNSNQLRTNEYLDVLMWLETASEDLIAGAYWTSTGAVKQDLRTGIQSLMDSERPALANFFPELVIAPIKLDDLPARFIECEQPLETLKHSLSERARNPMYPLKGYGSISAAIHDLKNQGKISPSQSVLLDAELAALK
jgi:hypothetical protein